MAVPARAFPFIIGPKGSKAAEITDASGARFDIDRSNSCVVLKGNPDACQKLKELIEEIMEAEGITGTPAVVEETAVVRVVDTGHVKDFGPIPGAAYDPIAAAAAKARAADMGMSKSASRRRRRKEQDLIEKDKQLSDLAEEVESNGVQGSDDADQDEDSNEEDENDEEDEDESEYSESPAITTPDEEEETVPQIPTKEISAPINTKRSATDTAITSRTAAAPVGIIGRSPPQASKPIEVSKTATSTAEQKEVYEKSYNHFNPQGFTLPLQTPDIFYDAADTIAVTPVVKEEKKPVAVVTPKVVPAVVVPKISPAVVAPKVAPAVVTPKIVPAVASTPVPANRGASSGLLDMLLGYNTPLPTTTKHEQQPALTVKLSQEHERAAATPTTSVPSFSKPAPAPSPTPAIARETEAVENRKSGYYKSKTGFSVRL
jgi:KH domain